MAQIGAESLAPGLCLVTSSLVVNETFSLLQSRGFFSAALEFLRAIRSDPSIEIVYVDPALQAMAWDLFRRRGGAGANAIDCASFAIMRSRGIRRALSFDGHFRQAGFQILS